ncbi:hypothetical protein QYM36_018623 [Artemia franciscana]|uniref:Uncharacterized protein n=1 Tax=Artemia franciscana TaxID=6661 RepID=A0AA88KRE6_ARTSF|nr:hypothetical protein QYM36_018623 [Artemia franciscana]
MAPDKGGKETMSHFGMTNEGKVKKAIEKTGKANSQDDFWRYPKRHLSKYEMQRNATFISRNLHTRYIKYNGLMEIAPVAMLTGSTIITTHL